jgi:hypothetical protein
MRPTLAVVTAVGASLSLALAGPFVHGQVTATFKGHKNTITCLTVVPVGQTLVSGSDSLRRRPG